MTHRPPRYPVFCKPVTNLKGMGAGTSVLESERDFGRNADPGDFWMKLMTGRAHQQRLGGGARRDGVVPAHARHSRAWPAHSIIGSYRRGTRRGLERYCRDWIRANLPDYTGMVNIETIGGRIIEAHLRFADQWPDLYGRNG